MDLLAALNATPNERTESSSNVRILRSKDGDELRTELTEEQALEIVSQNKSDFAQSLVAQYVDRGLSPAQFYWLFKLAEDNRPIKPTPLLSNLQEFCSVVPTMQFRINISSDTTNVDIGKVLLRTTPDGILVQYAWKTHGRIVGDQFFPLKSCATTVKSLLYVFSADPKQFMLQHGKDTGVCCICGRELTNEESVAAGIGPICSSKMGW